MGTEQQNTKQIPQEEYVLLRLSDGTVEVVERSKAIEFYTNN